MAVSIKTASPDYCSTTYDHEHKDVVPVNVVPVSATEEGMYAELERGEYNFVKFVREKTQQDVARVKLVLYNNSKRLMEWVIKCSNGNIQALSKASGLIKPFDTAECILLWRRSTDYNSWREIPSLKMMLQIKLISSGTGKAIGKASSKFRAVVDPDAVCKVDKPPVHNIVLNCEPAPMIIRKEKPNILKFAVEKDRPDVARVKLLLFNDSNRQMQWVFKCADTAITAEPVLSGRMGKLGSNEVNLIWQRPKAAKKWTDVPQPKMQLFMKLIAPESGKEVADVFAKFKAMINPQAECTIDDLPIHKVTLKSEAIAEQSEADESYFKNDRISNAIARPENFLKDPETLFWLIVVLCCFLGIVILQSISDDGRRSRRRGTD
uniref:Major sperm protein n=1 Tax=Elaeophora elaphi TaxID=1147741 RepID=A0A0R3RXZ7_9BILA